MNAQDILDLIRDQSYQTTSQLPDATLIKYLNIVKNDFFSYLITAVDEDYNWDYFTSNIVSWQSEYVLPEVAFDASGILKVKEVYVAYTGDTYDDGSLEYAKAVQVGQSELKKGWHYYMNNQDIYYPIFYVADRSIFLAPTPTEAIINGLMVRGIKNIPDYTTATTEADLRIPVTYQHILIQGTLPYVYKRIGDIEKSNFEQAEYIRKRTEVIRELWNRVIGPSFMKIPETRQNDFIID
jgi:hypothetical protein